MFPLPFTVLVTALGDVNPSSERTGGVTDVSVAASSSFPVLFAVY